MKTAKRSRAVIAKRRAKSAKSDGGQFSTQVSLKRAKVKYTARELAGCLSRYAKGRPDPVRVREFVRQEVARATAQEG